MAKYASTSEDRPSLSPQGRFLRAAASVLRSERRPLGVDEITKLAIQSNQLLTEGRTPASTLRAKLSTELRHKGAASIFQRTGTNRFALREWGLPEYFAPPFIKGPSTEVLACVPRDQVDPIQDSFFGLNRETSRILGLISDPRKITFLNRPAAEVADGFRQLVSYVRLLTQDGGIVSYVRGGYSEAHRMLVGKRSIGFGGHVRDVDADSMFGRSDAGVREAAIREVSEELKGVVPQTLSIDGLIWDDSSVDGYHHIGVVLTGYVPAGFAALSTRRELAIAGVRILRPVDLWEYYHQLEFWSQLLVRQFYHSERPIIITRICPAASAKRIDALAVVGEIGTGKTMLCSAMSQQFGLSTVSARQCLIPLLNVPDFGVGNREVFQEAAQRLITSPDGPSLLAHNIAKAVSDAPTRPVLIDGIRHRSTVRALRRELSDLRILFVDAPRDLAFSNYRERAGGLASIHEFARAREHPVETEVRQLLEESDVLLYNADGARDAIDSMSDWLKQRLP